MRASAGAAIALDGSQVLLTAGARTDCFADPSGGEVRFNAPMLLCEVKGDFQLTTEVSVEFGEVFDAGALVVYFSDSRWAKLCLEYSPDRQPQVISVVTRGRSDDAPCFYVASPRARLRITRRGPALAFHAAGEEEGFELVRHFALVDAAAPLQVGFGTQSPNGEGCRATFANNSLMERSVADLRRGE
jgi:hypothetical protein